MPALVDELPQLGTQPGQIGELTLHFGQVCARDLIHIGTRPRSVIGEPQQFSHRAERKS